MENPSKNKGRKVYCEKCDLIFHSLEQFEKHLNRHSSGTACETCPIDTVIAKLVNLIWPKPSRNLE